MERVIISRRVRLWRKSDLSRAHIMIPGTRNVCDEYLHSLSHFCPPIVRLLRRSRSFFTSSHDARLTFSRGEIFARSTRVSLTTVILTRGRYANREVLPVYCARLNIGFYIHAHTVAPSPINHATLSSIFIAPDKIIDMKQINPYCNCIWTYCVIIESEFIVLYLNLLCYNFIIMFRIFLQMESGCIVEFKSANTWSKSFK